MSNTPSELYGNIPRIFLFTMITLILAHIGLMILNYGYDHDYVFGLAHFLTLDGEGTIPAWFSSIILCNSGFLLYLIYKTTADVNKDRFWAFLAVIFVYLSIDEMVGLHELLDIPLREQFDAGGLFHFTWIIAGGGFVAIVGLLSIPFLRRIPSKTAIHFICAGALYVLGAIGLEMIGGNIEYSHFVVNNNTGRDPLIYMIVLTMEETLEMSAIVYFNFVLIRYLKFASNETEVY